MTKAMRTAGDKAAYSRASAAEYDIKLHSNPAYVKAYRERLEAERYVEMNKIEMLKPKTWSI